MRIADCLRGESGGRLRRESGRHALVDGIPFTLPVASHESPALMAAFSIDAHAAAELLPGDEVHPLRVWGERALLLISVVDYRSTNIGRYIEFSVAIACTHGERPAPTLTPALPLAQRLYGTGQYVIDLPVSSEVSVKGGKGIWGMPKHQANLDFVIAPRKVSSQYDLDGQLCVRIEVDRPRFEALPLSLATSNYCAFRGMLMKSNISFRGRAGFNLPLTRSARLQIGDHPARAGAQAAGDLLTPAVLRLLPLDRRHPRRSHRLVVPVLSGAAERRPGRVGERRRSRPKPGVACAAAGPGAR